MDILKENNYCKNQWWFVDSTWGGGGENYLIAHIHRRFRHAHHETKVWLSSLGSQGRRREDKGTILNCLKVKNKEGRGQFNPPVHPKPPSLQTGRKEMFYLTTHSTHFIYGYMASLFFKQGPEEGGWPPALLYLWYVLFIKLAFFGFAGRKMSLMILIKAMMEAASTKTTLMARNQPVSVIRIMFHFNKRRPVIAVLLVGLGNQNYISF